MERRFELIRHLGVRDVTSYQKLVAENPDLPQIPYTVIIIDELADLMILARKAVEEAIMRLAQKARAVGIYLVLSTQRPSVDIITGMIKANVPSRIAFRTVSPIDSKNILDATGAEKLCGNGDMLFLPIGATSPLRIQGAFVSGIEIHEAVCELLRSSNAENGDQKLIAAIDDDAALFLRSRKDLITEIKENPLLLSAIEIAVSVGTLSTSRLQRQLHIGYVRTAKIIDTLENFEIIAPYEGNGSRKVLISEKELRIIQKAVENY
jgi:S-DNA-T family DNA segregation ATPase FtsK/SpoIIIE